MVLLEEKNAPKTSAGLPLKEALQAWLDWVATARAPETVLLMRLAADSLMASLSPGKQRRLSVDGFTLRHGDKWLEALSKNGLAPATINLRIRTINAFFGWVFERRMLAVLHFTGTRRREIFYLPWENIALGEGLIYIRSHALFTIKEGREKVLPLAPALLSFLQQERQANPAEVWLMDDGAGKLAYHFAAALTLAIRRHMQALGFAGRGIKPIHGHRAALASRLWSDGVDLTTVQKALGHSDIQVTQGYLPDATPVVRAAFESMKDVGVAKILAKIGNKTANNP